MSLEEEEDTFKELTQKQQQIIEEQDVQIHLKNEEILKLCEQIQECQNRLVETQELVLQLGTQLDDIKEHNSEKQENYRNQFLSFPKRQNGNKKFISII